MYFSCYSYIVLLCSEIRRTQTCSHSVWISSPFHYAGSTCALGGALRVLRKGRGYPVRGFSTHRRCSAHIFIPKSQRSIISDFPRTACHHRKEGAWKDLEWIMICLLRLRGWVGLWKSGTNKSSTQPTLVVVPSTLPTSSVPATLAPLTVQNIVTTVNLDCCRLDPENDHTSLSESTVPGNDRASRSEMQSISQGWYYVFGVLIHADRAEAWSQSSKSTTGFCHVGGLDTD
jgi:hypothetical protein